MEISFFFQKISHSLDIRWIKITICFKFSKFHFFKEDKVIKIPKNLFIQKIKVNLECLNSEVNLNLVFGIKDNLTLSFKNPKWTIMNQSWKEFSSITQITESDLWSNDIECDQRCLLNAKIYPLLHPNLNKEDMKYLNDFFLIDLNDSSKNLTKTWRMCLRLSFEDILECVDLTYIFSSRRKTFNTINNKRLVQNVLENRVIQFNSLIKNAVLDGHANELLKNFDEGLNY